MSAPMTKELRTKHGIRAIPIRMLEMFNLRPFHIPIVFGTLFFANLMITYWIAVFNGYVEPILPYLSATGDHRPASCFFSLFLNLSSFFGALAIYFRFQLVDLITGRDVSIHRMNVWSFYIGVLGALAMMVVANFQETAIIPVHLGAAVTCFGCGCIYAAIQAQVTLQMVGRWNNKRIAAIRVAITIVSVFSLFVAVGFGVAAAMIYHKTFPDKPTPRPWSRKTYQPGYELHVVSAFFEWVLAACQAIYILTFTFEFSKIHANMVVDCRVRHLDHSPQEPDYRGLLDTQEI